MKLKRVLKCFKIAIGITATALSVSGAILVLMSVRQGLDVLDTYSAEANMIVKESTEKSFRKQETSFIYDAEGNQIAKLRLDKDTQYVEYADIPNNVINAFIAVEDRNFWNHEGIDLKGILRVGSRFLMTQGDEVHGASTITQQLARNVFLTQDVTIERKIKEIFVSTSLEKKYDKKQIMEFYINSIYYGNGYYGIGAAAKGYFNKPLGELSISQVALLCGIPNNPSAYDPIDNLERSLLRRDKIIKDMMKEGFITEEEGQMALAEDIVIEEQKLINKSGYESFATHCAVKYLMKSNGFQFRYSFENNEDYETYNLEYNKAYDFAKYKLLVGGYHVYTTLDPKAQEILQRNLDDTLSFNKELSDGMYTLQGAATCIDNETGKVVAIVGQRTPLGEAKASSLNRAYQSNRQPGSTIKPIIVYAPALENGYTADTIVDDSPIKDGPKNSGSYSGKITLRKAVEHSKNVVAWSLFEALGAEKGLSYAQKMQFSKIVPEDYYLSASLGGLTYGVNTLEMSSAYATLVNDGSFREPTCIRSILKDGKEIYTEESPIAVYSSEASQSILDILEGVLISGTASSLHWDQEKMSAAGKTGTTNDNKDGWFCGVTPYYSITVWVGYDVPRPVKGLWGSTYPAAIWKNSMLELIKDKNFKEFNKESIKQIEEEEKSEPIFGSEEWFSRHEDNEELSAGYTVGQYKTDLLLEQEVIRLSNEISVEDPNALENRANVLDKYSQTLTIVNQIYGTTVKQRALETLSNSYAIYQSKMQ